MFCKFCGCEMEPECKVCPDCGKAAGNGQGMKIAVIAICAVILCAVLVVAVLFGTGVLGGKEEKTATEPTETVTEPTESATDFKSYTVDDAKAAAVADDVVAVVGKQTLTNGELQLHYWAQVYSFLNDYYYYISMLGMDLTVGLDQQTCYFDTTQSWQEYFLTQALESWKSYAVLCEIADAAEFEWSEKDQTYIAGLADSITADALSYGYESVEAMLLAEAGPGCNMDGMVSYRTVMYNAMQYFAVKYEEMTPSAEEINAYFDEHAAELEASSITKDSGKIGSVRHILIAVEGGTTDENGNTVYSDEEWATCLAEAERVYKLWKDGEATEDSFVAMVSEHTDDTGSATTGGLYEDISAESSYVEEFRDWATDAQRQVGDTDLVKTVYGYHFMYYVSGEDVWYATARDQMLNERFADFMNAGMEQYPMDVDYEKVALGYLSLAG